MDTEETVLLQVFSTVCEKFGRPHARIYWSLINFPCQSVPQLENRLGIAHTHLYSIMSELLAKGLITLSSTRPKCYSARPVLRLFQRLMNQKTMEITRQLDHAHQELTKIIQNGSTQSGEEYHLKIFQGQTQLFNAKTNTPLDPQQIHTIKKNIDEIARNQQTKIWQGQPNNKEKHWQALQKP